MSHVTILIVPG